MAARWLGVLFLGLSEAWYAPNNGWETTPQIATIRHRDSKPLPRPRSSLGGYSF